MLTHKTIFQTQIQKTWFYLCSVKLPIFLHMASNQVPVTQIVTEITRKARAVHIPKIY